MSRQRYTDTSKSYFFDKMPFIKSILPFFRSLFFQSKPPVGMRWPEEPLDLPVDRHGGFYNASLGTVLNSRYIVVGKIGWGQHANVK